MSESEYAAFKIVVLEMNMLDLTPELIFEASGFKSGFRGSLVQVTQHQLPMGRTECLQLIFEQQ